MRMVYFIGTDIGTSGTKSVVVDEKGHIAGEAYKPYPVMCPYPGWAEQDAVAWECAVYDTIRLSLEQAGVVPSDIHGIYVSGLFAGSGVPLDAYGKPVRPSIIWMDQRAAPQWKRLETAIGSKAIEEVSGNRHDPYFGYCKMLWIKENEPDNWNKIRLLLPSHSYVVYRMTGQITIDYTGAANIGGIFNYKTFGWDSIMLKEMGIPLTMMPQEWHSSCEIAGKLTPDAGRRMGLLSGIPVCAGGTDCLSSNLAAGAMCCGENTAIIGTSINWGVLHEGWCTELSLVTMPDLLNPQRSSYTYGGATSAGSITRWFRETLARYSITETKTVETTFSTLEDESESIPPGSEGLLVLPYFMGERTPVWDGQARGAITGLTLRHTRAHIYHALLEATAYSLRDIIETAKEFFMPENACVVSGGAVTSKLWMQLLSDVTGLEIRCTHANAQAPLANALLAAHSVGAIDDVSVIKEWVDYSCRYTPNLKNKQIYDKIFPYYKQLYPSLKQTTDFLSSFNG